MFSEAAAKKAVDFIQRLKHTKGEWAGRKFILEQWQREQIIEPLFGTITHEGYRQYRTCYIELPRKNGKSELAAGVALKLLMADQEPGAEIYSAAADRDQASLVFNVAARMVRQDPVLTRRCKVVDSTRRIVVPSTGNVYRAISADVKTKHGYDAHGIIFDELHAQPNRDLWDVLTTSTGSRRQPLIFAITTAGYDRSSICWEQHQYAQAILEGQYEDPSFLPVIYAAGEKDDWTDEKTWFSCNPALGVFRSIDEMRNLFRKAQRMPGMENTFKRLYLNLWTEQATRWLPMEEWDSCDKGPIDEKSLIGRPCFGALDLAASQDLVAFVMAFPPLEKGGDILFVPRFWIPEESMRERSKKDRVPYDIWVRSGLIKATPGNVVQYDDIFTEISRCAMIFNMKEVCYDRWGATQITQQLQNDGMTVIPFGQGYTSMSSPTKELLHMIMSKRINHGGNPILRWNAKNMVVTTNASGDVKPDKGKSVEKIDGIVSCIMALDAALKNKAFRSCYEERGVVTA